MNSTQCPHCGEGQCFCEPIPPKPEEQEKEHVFQVAGLGQAPFRLVGYRQEVGPINPVRADGTIDHSVLIGAPGQPMGTCDFCGNGIKHVFVIESSDGKRFRTGSECVYKTGDAGLKKVVDQKVRDLKREARHEREEAQIEELEVMLSQREVQDVLSAHPHPRAILPQASDFFKAQSLWDWSQWMMLNAGNSGKLRVFRTVKKILRTRNDSEEAIRDIIEGLTR